MEVTRFLGLPRVFSATQVCLLLGISRRKLNRMIREGRMMVIKGTGRLRILDPRWTALAGLTLGSVEDAHVFKSAEVGILLGITPRMVRFLSGQGKLHFVVVGKRRFYSLSAIREALRERNKGMEGRKKLGIRPWLLEWAKQRL